MTTKEQQASFSWHFVTAEDLPELWSISYGPQADLRWMAFNGPYFEDPILDWPVFRELYLSTYIQTETRAVIVYQNRIIGLLTAQWQDGSIKKWLEFGISLYDEKVWNLGIASAILPEWIDCLFAAHPAIQHLGFTTWSGNPGMMRVGEKLGLALEARIRSVRFWQGNYYDSLKYGILRAEWATKKSN